MVQKTFGVYADDLSGCRLFIEAGGQHIAAWFTDTLSGSLKAFEFFQFEIVDEGSLEEIVQEIKLSSQLLSMQMDAALIIWENEACTFVPVEFYRDDMAGEYLDIIASEAENSLLLEEHFNEYIVVSRYSAQYAKAIKKHLAEGPFTHKFTSLLKKYSKLPSINTTFVRAVFYPARFILTVMINGVLQLVQCISYATAEDVLYSILHVCNEYSVALDGTPIITSGLINSGSSLFDTLYKYLENVEIEQELKNTFAAGGFAEHPAQYFLPFIQ